LRDRLGGKALIVNRQTRVLATPTGLKFTRPTRCLWF
jgi:hypothetical protein